MTTTSKTTGGAALNVARGMLEAGLDPSELRAALTGAPFRFQPKEVGAALAVLEAEAKRAAPAHLLDDDDEVPADVAAAVEDEMRKIEALRGARNERRSAPRASDALRSAGWRELETTLDTKLLAGESLLVEMGPDGERMTVSRWTRSKV